MNSKSITSIKCSCGEMAAAVTGKEIYPHRPDLFHKKFFLCACGRYVGAHANGTPLGTPADYETREARKRAHTVFDALWKQGRPFATRSAAYEWLTKALGATKQVHIGESSREQADKIYDVSVEMKRQSSLKEMYGK